MVLMVKPRACMRADKGAICARDTLARVYARTLHIINTLNKKIESMGYKR